MNENQENSEDEAVLSPFPVDELTLLAVEHALGGVLEYSDEEEGELVLTGAEYNVWQLFDFLAGVTDEDYELAEEFDDEYGEVYHCSKPTFDYHDLVQALIDEVRRLRELVPEDQKESQVQ